MFVYCFFGFWFFAKGFPGIESSWVPPGLYLTFIIVLDCVPFSLEYNLSESLITGTFLPGNAFFLDYHNFVFKVPILSYVISPFRYLSHRKVAFFLWRFRNLPSDIWNPFSYPPQYFTDESQGKMVTLYKAFISSTLPASLLVVVRPIPE